jgi:hypothetical protein
MTVSIDDLVASVSALSDSVNATLAAVNVQKSFLDNAASGAGANAQAAAVSAGAAAAAATATAADRTAADASATGAAASAAAAHTSEVNAANSSTAASSAATAAATSKTGADTSASNAATSATNAGGSATAAAASAAAAHTSEVNAANSSTAAAANAGAAATANANANTAMGAASSSATQAATARDQAIAAWAASAAPAEQLAAFSQSIHFGAIVDVALYDTSKDSDGGAWRKRCLHASWYNEAICTGKWRGQLANLAAAWAVSGAAVGDFYQNTTDGKFYTIGGTSAAPTQTEVFRGNTREFPQLVAIAAELGRIVCYDVTQPGAPMWMVFAGSATGEVTAKSVPSDKITSIAVLNGVLLVGATDTGTWFGGLWVTDFVKDQTTKYVKGNTFTGVYAKPSGIAARNTSETYAKLSSTLLAALQVFDVAIVTLPGAPIDPATGLPTLTVAVATGGGASVIKQDGTVVNSSSTSAYKSVAIGADGSLFASVSGNSFIHYARSIGLLAGSFALSSYSISSIPALLASGSSRLAPVKGVLGVGSDSAGLSLLKENPATPAKGMVAAIAIGYNSGWMVGDIRAAWLADTVTETVAGSGEMAVNGAFTADLSGWQMQVSGASTVTWNAGAAQLSPDGANPALLSQAYATVAGRSYTVTFDVGGNPVIATVGTVIGGATIYNTVSATTPVGTKRTFTFTATGAVSYVNFTRTAAVVVTIDNVSVKLASPDRSVKANGTIINGSITKGPVAAGAQLVGFSGFSAANYLEQPYNSDLDFGTGDFCVMGWFKAAATSSTQPFMMSRGPSSGGATTFDAFQDASGFIKARAAGVTITGSANLCDAVWHQLVMQRVGGTLYAYIDTLLVGSAACAGTVSNAAATFRLGTSYDGANPYNGTLALWRATATGLSTDQIAQAYRDELALFQPSARCTLDGTSNAVTALAYDDTADILHVGTSWGRSAFHGLQLVESAATQVGAVSTLAAGQGAHITAGSASGRYVQPAMLLRDELRRRDDARRAMAKEEIPFDFDGITAQTAFQLPIGYTTKGAFVAGTKKRLGSTKDYTVSFDGYRETVNFGVSPGAVWVQITANRSN